ncbi:MAG TPA: diguanylate cyclase [Thermoleophilaceae bacterium]|nr:diguanylate cyclase [Thermoleophilaceae bacterium]
MVAPRARVLVFDGPSQVLAPLTLWLLDQGFAVHRSDQAGQALAAVSGRSAFELLVVDALIPDGIELARAARSGTASRHMAIVLVTGDDQPATAATQALAVGADDVLTPSQDEAELLARLTALSRLAIMETEWCRREAVLRRFGVEPEEQPAARAAPATAAERLRILLVGEASGEQVQVTAAFGNGVTAAYADGVGTALEILAGQSLDAVVLTSTPGPADTERLCRWLRAHPRLFDLPALLIARPDAVADRGLPYRWGVSDVLYQPLHPAMCRLRVQSWVRRQRLRRRLRGETIERRPLTQDRLTGLYSHGFLHEYLDDLLHGVGPGDPPAALAVFNVAGMARLNEARGYVAGDRALAAVAATLARSARASDLVARLGGDEFAVVLNGSDAAGAIVASERLVAAVAAATSDQGGHPGLGLHVGITEIAPRQHTAASLVREARARSRRAQVRCAS